MSIFIFKIFISWEELCIFYTYAPLTGFWGYQIIWWFSPRINFTDFLNCDLVWFVNPGRTMSFDLTSLLEDMYYKNSLNRDIVRRSGINRYGLFWADWWLASASEKVFFNRGSRAYMWEFGDYSWQFYFYLILCWVYARVLMVVGGVLVFSCLVITFDFLFFLMFRLVGVCVWCLIFWLRSRGWPIEGIRIYMFSASLISNWRFWDSHLLFALVKPYLSYRGRWFFSFVCVLWFGVLKCILIGFVWLSFFLLGRGWVIVNYLESFAVGVYGIVLSLYHFYVIVGRNKMTRRLTRIYRASRAGRTIRAYIRFYLHATFDENQYLRFNGFDVKNKFWVRWREFYKWARSIKDPKKLVMEYAKDLIFKMTIMTKEEMLERSAQRGGLFLYWVRPSFKFSFYVYSFIRLFISERFLWGLVNPFKQLAKFGKIKKGVIAEYYSNLRSEYDMGNLNSKGRLSWRLEAYYMRFVFKSDDYLMYVLMSGFIGLLYKLNVIRSVWSVYLFSLVFYKVILTENSVYFFKSLVIYKSSFKPAIWFYSLDFIKKWRFIYVMVESFFKVFIIWPCYVIMYSIYYIIIGLKVYIVWNTFLKLIRRFYYKYFMHLERIKQCLFLVFLVLFICGIFKIELGWWFTFLLKVGVYECVVKTLFWIVSCIVQVWVIDVYYAFTESIFLSLPLSTDYYFDRTSFRGVVGDILCNAKLSVECDYLTFYYLERINPDGIWYGYFNLKDDYDSYVKYLLIFGNHFDFLRWPFTGGVTKMYDYKWLMFYEIGFSEWEFYFDSIFLGFDMVVHVRTLFGFFMEFLVVPIIGSIYPMLSLYKFWYTTVFSFWVFFLTKFLQVDFQFMENFILVSESCFNSVLRYFGIYNLEFHVFTFTYNILVLSYDFLIGDYFMYWRRVPVLYKSDFSSFSFYKFWDLPHYWNARYSDIYKYRSETFLTWYPNPEYKPMTWVSFSDGKFRQTMDRFAWFNKLWHDWYFSYIDIVSPRLDSLGSGPINGLFFGIMLFIFWKILYYMFTFFIRAGKYSLAVYIPKDTFYAWEHYHLYDTMRIMNNHEFMFAMNALTSLAYKKRYLEIIDLEDPHDEYRGEGRGKKIYRESEESIIYRDMWKEYNSGPVPRLWRLIDKMEKDFHSDLFSSNWNLFYLKNLYWKNNVMSRLLLSTFVREETSTWNIVGLEWDDHFMNLVDVEDDPFFSPQLKEMATGKLYYEDLIDFTDINASYGETYEDADIKYFKRYIKDFWFESQFMWLLQNKYSFIKDIYKELAYFYPLVFGHLKEDRSRLGPQVGFPKDPNLYGYDYYWSPFYSESKRSLWTSMSEGKHKWRFQFDMEPAFTRLDKWWGDFLNWSEYIDREIYNERFNLLGSVLASRSVEWVYDEEMFLNFVKVYMRVDYYAGVYQLSDYSQQLFHSDFLTFRFLEHVLSKHLYAFLQQQEGGYDAMRIKFDGRGINDIPFFYLVVFGFPFFFTLMFLECMYGTGFKDRVELFIKTAKELFLPPHWLAQVNTGIHKLLVNEDLLLGSSVVSYDRFLSAYTWYGDARFSGTRGKNENMLFGWFHCIDLVKQKLYFNLYGLIDLRSPERKALVMALGFGNGRWPYNTVYNIVYVIFNFFVFFIIFTFITEICSSYFIIGKWTDRKQKFGGYWVADNLRSVYKRHGPFIVHHIRKKYGSLRILRLSRFFKLRLREFRLFMQPKWFKEWRFFYYWKKDLEDRRNNKD